jgi:RHS repeat-associated protein
MLIRTNNTSAEEYSLNMDNQMDIGPGGIDHFYDVNGNQTGLGIDYAFEYDDENRLTAMEYLGGVRVEYRYDARGRLRLERHLLWDDEWQWQDEMRYVYDGMLLVQERDYSNSPRITYTRGLDLAGEFASAGGIGGLLARSGGWTLSTSVTNVVYYHADGNGNISYLMKTNHTVAASYRYDPFGQTISSTGDFATDNRLRFSSKQYHDMPFGYGGVPLCYFGYRFYDPTAQRWLNRDPSGEKGGQNLYAFVMNQPVSRVDSLGLEYKDCSQNKHEGYVACDGNGNWEIVICNQTRPCTYEHEYAHLIDYMGKYPNACLGPVGKGEDPIDGPGYDKFICDSEADAYGAEAACLKKLCNVPEEQLRVAEAMERWNRRPECPQNRAFRRSLYQEAGKKNTGVELR